MPDRVGLLWRRALCVMFGHDQPSQRGHIMRSSHSRCLRCGELLAAPMEPIS